MRHAGFSLISLIVAIFLLGTMIVIVTPSLLRSREAKRRTACADNMKAIH